MAGLADHQVTRESAREQSEPATIAPESSASFDLADEIWKVAKRNPIGISPEGYYFPDDEYGRLLRRDTIQSALGGGDEISSLVKYVLSHAKKTFATLVRVFPHCKDRREVMYALMADEFKDDLLENDELDRFRHLHKLWNGSTIDDFKAKRLPFIVPTFDIEIFKYEFDKERLLPFMGLNDTPSPSSGYFSEVECVEMLASKQNKVKVPEKTIKVALKKLKRIPDSGYNIKREWEREARAHQQLNQKSGNIIQAFGAYRQIALNGLDEYYLILEWANGGSLFNFWEAHPEPQVDDPDVGKVRWRIKEILEQLHGLADALDAMHSGSTDVKNWRHGDITPENILRFLDDKNIDSLGVLKLADLGRAQQHRDVTSKRNTKETELWRTRWYEPPDLEKKMHEEAQGKISRLFDIWSMGCVIFEAVLWLLYGHESDGEFVKDNGFTTGEKGATPYWRKDNGGNYLLTQTVTKWMEHILTRDPERNGAIGELVKLVRDRLLKINLPPNSDFYSKGFRTNAQDLKKQLGNILTRANEDERYLFRGATRLNVPRPHQAKSTTKNSSQSTNS